MNMRPPAFRVARRPRRRKRGVAVGSPPPPAAPVLVAATFDATFLRLTFDVPINIDAFDGSQVTVDGNTASTAELSDPSTVQIVIPGLMSGSNLNASGASGIVSASGAVAWGGVDDLGLPFP